MESEANISLEDLPEEIQFCRDLILNGEFDTAVGFMDIFTKDENFPYNQCVYVIKKQQFLELVENNDEVKKNFENILKLITCKRMMWKNWDNWVER